MIQTKPRIITAEFFFSHEADDDATDIRAKVWIVNNPESIIHIPKPFIYTSIHIHLYHLWRTAG